MTLAIAEKPRGRGAVRARSIQLRSLLMAPGRYSLMYLAGTFLIFLLSNLVGEVENMIALCVFVGLAYGGFYLGFRTGALSSRLPATATRIEHFGATRWQLWLVVLGSLYFLFWAGNQLYEFGGTSPGEIIRGILSPGASYKAKFEIYELRLDTNRVSRLLQVLVLLSILYAINIPLAITSWPRLSLPLRGLFLLSVLVYVASFLFIGTMKGVGDVFLFALAGMGVLLAKQAVQGRRFITDTQARVLLAVLAVAVFAYMANNQVARAEEFGITESRIVGDVSNTLLAKIFGHNVAYGVYTVLAYPSHGYLGLSYSLQQPFEFSYGAGFSQALESYRFQVFGGEDLRYLTYPYRAETATGWPAGMYWSTIFPWLASDMTFFLVPVFMALLGFIFARVWIACIFRRSVLALAAFGQFVIFVAFIPANNQVLMQRQGLWVVLTLLALWVFNRLGSRTAGRARA